MIVLLEYWSSELCLHAQHCTLSMLRDFLYKVNCTNYWPPIPYHILHNTWLRKSSISFSKFWLNSSSNALYHIVTNNIPENCDQWCITMTLFRFIDVLHCLFYFLFAYNSALSMFDMLLYAVLRLVDTSVLMFLTV